jgi:hypothetical protein
VRFAHYDGRSGYDEQRQELLDLLDADLEDARPLVGARPARRHRGRVLAGDDRGQRRADAERKGGAGRVAIWTNDTTQATTIQIGAGTAAPEDVILRRVTVRARESKFA